MTMLTIVSKQYAAALSFVTVLMGMIVIPLYMTVVNSFVRRFLYTVTTKGTASLRGRSFFLSLFGHKLTYSLVPQKRNRRKNVE